MTSDPPAFILSDMGKGKYAEGFPILPTGLEPENSSVVLKKAQNANQGWQSLHRYVQFSCNILTAGEQQHGHSERHVSLERLGTGFRSTSEH